MAMLSNGELNQVLDFILERYMRQNSLSLPERRMDDLLAYLAQQGKACQNLIKRWKRETDVLYLRVVMAERPTGILPDRRRAACRMRIGFA